MKHYPSIILGIILIIIAVILLTARFIGTRDVARAKRQNAFLEKCLKNSKFMGFCYQSKGLIK